MGRNFSLPTIKTLFAEANACAFPDCCSPLVFRDRGAATAIADIAHIRSESPSGPRFDADFAGDLNAPDNLILLCGIHHRPVDRHESLYPIEELLSWKREQVAGAQGGTSLSEADLRALSQLSSEERIALAQVARLVERLSAACRLVQDEVTEIRSENDQMRRLIASRFGPIYEVDEEGNRSPTPKSTDSFVLSKAEQDVWDAKITEAYERHTPVVRTALQALAEEIAVLRMQAPGLRTSLAALSMAAQAVPGTVGSSDGPSDQIAGLEYALDLLWAVATGQAPG